MKNLKKLLMCIACALTLAFAGVINFIPVSANKAFASQGEPIPISTGVEINTAIKSLQTQTGGSFKNIFFMCQLMILNRFMVVRFIQQNLFMKK